jgi:TonB family protein
MGNGKINSVAAKGRRCLHYLGLLALVLCFCVALFTAQTQEQSTRERKLISRVEPEYPDTLKRLYIGGVVRVEAIVAPNGKVKGTTLIGGSPILGQSTMKAVKQWKYAPAPSEETIIVTMTFDPHR